MMQSVLQSDKEWSSAQVVDLQHEEIRALRAAPGAPSAASPPEAPRKHCAERPLHTLKHTSRARAHPEAFVKRPQIPLY